LEYFNKNHLIDPIAKSLLKFSQGSKLSWKMLEEKSFLGRGYAYSFFDWMRAFVRRKGFLRP
jgi:hypothetical protein